MRTRQFIRLVRTPLTQQLVLAMKSFLPAFLLFTALTAHAAPAVDEAGEQKRLAIPLGGDFRPDSKVPAFVVVGHGGRILVSKDDGRTWTQAFFAAPGADHGPWATKSVAYGGGVFVVAVGWGAPTIWLASEDGVRWRHLTKGEAKLPESKGDARVMPGTWGLAAGKGPLSAPDT